MVYSYCTFLAKLHRFTKKNIYNNNKLWFINIIDNQLWNIKIKKKIRESKIHSIFKY